MGNEYQLQPNESMIMRIESVSYNGASYLDDLILTDINLILIRKGLFGYYKGSLTFPLSQIKFFDGQPQVFLRKRFGMSPVVEIGFTSGQNIFSFSGTDTAKKLVEAINLIAMEQPINMDDYNGVDSPAYDSSAAYYKDMADDIKGIFGIKTTKKSQKSMPEKVSIRCRSCGASLAGNKGQVVKCPYCDTKQNL